MNDLLKVIYCRHSNIHTIFHVYFNHFWFGFAAILFILGLILSLNLNFGLIRKFAMWIIGLV